MTKILYQGHGSLRLCSDRGMVIYIDPFAGDGYDMEADLILVTHQHYDHNKLELPLRKPGCQVYQNMDALRDGVYQEATFGDVKVKATQAYNINHPKNECVGYLIYIDGKLLYFAGDTSKTEEMESMKSLGIDYAFLPIDGVYNMDAEEAAVCAEIIGANYTVPIHMKPGELFDMKEAKRFKAKGSMIFEAGKEYSV